MIHSENGISNIKGDPETILLDFVAVNIAVRRLLKQIGMQNEEVNEIMTGVMFAAAEGEDAGIVLKSVIKEIGKARSEREKHEEDQPC